MDDQEILRWRRLAWWVVLAAISGMILAGVWLYIPHRDPLVWPWVESNRPLFWFMFFAAMIAGASATSLLTVTAPHRRRKKGRSDISHH